MHAFCHPSRELSDTPVEAQRPGRHCYRYSLGGQSLVEDKVLVGHCVNFLPLRARVESGQTAASFLGQVRQTLFAAYDHQNYTYGRLVRKLNLQRDPGPAAAH